MTAPVRLRLSRRAGFDLQAVSRATNGLDAVNVARPGKWGNPFLVKECREAGFVGSDDEIARRCAEAFRVWLGPHWRENWGGPESERRRDAILSSLSSLRGKDLACWCKIADQHGAYVPCHADVLLSLANRLSCEEVRDENLRRAKGEAVR